MNTYYSMMHTYLYSVRRSTSYTITYIILPNKKKYHDTYQPLCVCVMRAVVLRFERVRR